MPRSVAPASYSLQSVFFDSYSFAIVFDYYPRNLRQFYTGQYKERGLKIEDKMLRRFAYQLLLGIDYMHAIGVTLI